MYVVYMRRTPFMKSYSIYVVVFSPAGFVLLGGMDILEVYIYGMTTLATRLCTGPRDHRAMICIHNVWKLTINNKNNEQKVHIHANHMQRERECNVCFWGGPLPPPACEV